MLVESRSRSRAARLVLAMVSALAMACGDSATAPLVDVGVLTPPTAVPVVGGATVLVYELTVMNERSEPVALRSIRISDDEGQILRTYAGATLDEETLLLQRDFRGRLAPGTPLQRGDSGLLFAYLEFDPAQRVPTALRHTIELADPRTGARQSVDYTLDVDRSPPLIVSPPVRGAQWLMDGALGPDSYHRRAVLPIDGRLWVAQRYAIDFEIIDDRGRLVVGDISDNANWFGFGAPIYAASDGRVIRVVDGAPEQTPPNFPENPTIANTPGNHIVVDMGDGNFALYAHMQSGSILPSEGDLLRAGDEVGRVGNTGNSTAPHLHFHIMDRPEPLESQGVPYVFDRFVDRGIATPVDLSRGVLDWSPDVQAPRREARRLPTLNRVSGFE